MTSNARGIAQQLFQPTPHIPDDWRALYSALDHRLAETLQRQMGVNSEQIHALLCHLSAAVQQGHLCIRVTSSAIEPSPQALFGFIEPNQKLVPLDLSTLSACKEKISPYLHIDDDRLYFQRHWIAESQFLEHLDRLQKAAPTAIIDNSTLQSEVAHLVASNLLQHEQAAAILSSGQHAMTVITGGPGTGKTYTAGHCLRALWLSLSPAQREQFHIAITAPTGKAAATLTSSIQRFVGQVEGFPQLQGQTLHKLLHLNASQIVATPLSSDLILIDECSMIDAQLFAQLLGAVKTGARIILMGDAEQLPAVEAGGLFADLVQATATKPCLTRLTVCRRAESPGILQLATAVQSGDWIAMQQIIQQNSDEVRQLDYQGSISQQHAHLIREALPRFQCHEQEVQSIQQLKTSIGAFRLLSPLRKGPWGVETLNSLFREAALAAHAHVFPIMITKNDDSQALFNGDIGLLIHPAAGSAYALFPHGETVHRLNATRLPPYEFAYCLSVHKSQGSEFQHVLMVVPEGSEHFGRQLFYTAATRAKRKLTLCAGIDIIQRMIAQSGARLSGIIARS